jgi:hypothetical protein
MTDPTSGSRSDVLFVGLPATGKTTYLALLFRAIVMGKAGSLRLGGYADDREYLNEVADALASCAVAIHTEVDQQQKLALSLTSGARAVYLTIPDMSGESWEHTLSDRAWTVEMDGRVTAADGFVVFIHADHIDTQPTIDQANAGFAALTGEMEIDSDLASAVVVEAEQVVEPDDIVRERATQVNVVDLLQLLASRHGPPIRVSLVVSAWDLVPDGHTPTVWVSENLPLVQQFVETNSQWLELKIWGVSAQGGDFENAQSRDQLLPQDTVDRSLIQNPDGEGCAVEDPVTWALGYQ